MINIQKAAVIGCGFVGSTIAYALMQKGTFSELVLLDANHAKAEGEAMDISHGLPFAHAMDIREGDYEDIADASVVIITAGANQKPGETRTDLLGRNVKIFASIIPQIVQNAPNTTLLIATNPVDVMTEVALKLSGFPKERGLGSGTVLDTARFRTDLGYHLGVSPKSIHANVLGEHGDSEVLCWSNGDSGTLPLEKIGNELGRPLTNEVKAKIDDDVRNAAYKIINGKGATFYGIAGALCRICQAITTNEYAVLTVSTHHAEIAGVKDVCISMPTVIGKRGVHDVLYPELDAEENRQLQESVKKMKKFSDEALAMVDGLLP